MLPNKPKSQDGPKWTKVCTQADNQWREQKMYVPHVGSWYQAQGATILWKCVPDTVQEWYILLIEGKQNYDICVCCNAIVDTSWFSACTKADPSSFFVDRGEELRAFHKDIGKRTLAGLLRQLRPKDLCSTNENTPSATTKENFQ